MHSLRVWSWFADDNTCNKQSMLKRVQMENLLKLYIKIIIMSNCNFNFINCICYLLQFISETIWLDCIINITDCRNDGATDSSNVALECK